MKKLVTLSAIALAGATLGVGTTFGWWAYDTAEEADKAKPKIAEQKPSNEPPGELNDILLKNVKSFDVKVVNPDFRPATGAEPKIIEAKPKSIQFQPHQYITIQSAPPAFEKLADQLEQEAKELEAQGRKEAAENQRKLAQRLRETLKAQPPRATAVQKGTDGLDWTSGFTFTKPVGAENILAEFKGGYTVGGVAMTDPVVAEATPADLKEQIAKLRTELSRLEGLAAAKPLVREPGKRYVANVKQVPVTTYRTVIEYQAVPFEKTVAGQPGKERAAKPEIELTLSDATAKANAEAEIAAEKARNSHKAVIQQQDSKQAALLAQLQELKAAQESIRDMKAKERAVKEQLAYQQQAKAGQLPAIAKELQEIAEQLERDGRKDEARAVRKQVERLLTKPMEGLLTITLGDDGGVRVEPKVKVSDKNPQVIAEHQARLEKMHKQQHVAENVESEHRGGGATIRIERDDRDVHHAQPPMAHHFGEMHKMLHELRHEIAELRQEVRGLHGLLKSDHQTGKRDRDEDDDRDVNIQSKERKHSDDDDRSWKSKLGESPKTRSTTKKGDPDAKKSKDRDGDDDDKSAISPPKKQDQDGGKQDDDDDDGDKSDGTEEDRKD